MCSHGAISEFEFPCPPILLCKTDVLSLVGGEGVHVPGLYYGRLSDQLHCELRHLSINVHLCSLVTNKGNYICITCTSVGRWLLTSQAPTGIPGLLSLCITSVLRVLTSTSLLSGLWAMSSRTMTGLYVTYDIV